jgi:membrane protease YdiL (CAAX protease family)
MLQTEMNMADHQGSRKQAAMYVLLVLAFSSVFYFLMLKAHTLGAGAGMFVFGIMWCPALAALATLKINGRSPQDLGWKWPQTKYAVQSWYIPLLYATIAYTIVWAVGWGGFPNHDFMGQLVPMIGLRASPLLSTVIYVLVAGTFGVIKSMASALGEEIGWRGFLVPQLFKSFSFTATALISGVIWACWHFPLLIWGDYNSGTPMWFGLSCFSVLVISISFVFAWMRLKSCSLWTGAILHASHNLYIQAIFTPMTRNTGKTAWYIDEFGAVLPLVALGFAIYFWTRRHELSPSSPELQT